MRDETLVACRRLMADGSKSFSAASRLLPGRVAAPAAALYAFCRVADDAIDLSYEPLQALAQLQRRLDAVYAGAPGPELADQALAEVVERFDLPRPLLDALLEGFAWDAEGRRYDTLEALHDYAARVAGGVGVMMAVLMETRDRTTLARAGELGLAMQLTNIARDVGEDARAGRLYLPREWMRHEGIDPAAWLREPRFDGALARVVARLLAEADRLYARAECGVAGLPRDCRAGIQAARLVYAAIGHQLARDGLDSVSRRTVVPIRRKLALMTRAAGAAVFAPGHPMDIGLGHGPAPLPSIRFLVDAAADDRRPERTFYQRTVRVLELFERVDLRRRPAA
ncbi:MAG: phytoene/squalene synthase family protein [Rubrivivax sp.]|nr:phytoene/squalene synthase family protein [Rubrivivax sp.]